jgi:hypothetical protein
MPSENQGPEQDGDDVDRLVAALLELNGDRDAFLRVVDAEPHVLGAEVERRLVDMSEMPAYGLIFADFAALVRGARTDPAGAWETFDRAMTEATALGISLP